VCYLGVGERRVCRGHVVHLGEPKQLQRSCVMFLFSRHFTDDTGLMHFSVFFHFAHDMGVYVFWVCPTTPASSADTIAIDPYIYGLN